VPGVFRVVRNPYELSTLPYLIELPLPSGPLRLKAKDTWPRTAKVYCHRADEWPADAEVVEEVAVRSCVRRGVAVDLVLDRSRENRSQIVFTTLKGGREGIFWQSARTTRKTRPGLRVPTRRSAAGELELIVDTRERYAWKFTDQQATTTKRALPVGDYGVELHGALVGVVERMHGRGDQISVAYLRPHDLRRTVARTLDARDAPIQDIRAVLRHDTIAATQIYLGDNSLRANRTMSAFVILLPGR
jgi:integrase